MEMAQHGVLYGHKKTKTHPKMKVHVGANRNEVELLKPESIIESLEAVTAFLKESVAQKRLVLIVATKTASKEAAQKFADTFGFPSVTTRWLGGTITNFPIIKERIKYYLELKRKRESGELEKYTKKERVDFDKEITKLEIKFEGLVRLERTPDVIFIVDTQDKSHRTAIREAQQKNIPIVGIIDTDDNPDDLTHPIFANDHARASISWIMEKITEGIQEGGGEDTKQDEEAKPSEETKKEERTE